VIQLTKRNVKKMTKGGLHDISLLLSRA